MQLSIQNRDATYISIIDKLPKKRKEVYNVIHVLKKATLRNIADYLGCEPSDISGRVTELKCMCLVKEVLTAQSKRTGNNVTVYSLTTEDERIERIKQKRTELTEKLNDYKGSLLLDLCETTEELLRKEIKKIERDVRALTKVL